RRHSRLLLPIVLIGTLAACTPERAKEREPAAVARSHGLHLCGAIRGNGAKVFSTIASMASFTENYGTFDALSGASSGALPDFFSESSPMRRVLTDWGGGPGSCHDDELVRRRAGLMLKAFQGYIDYVTSKDSPEASPIWVVLTFIKKLEEKKIDFLLAKDAA